ncbi:uncharacterized protein LOC113353098 [Papaver somniferum]|uniref:uncharacterized protein LOC113353098 n=1 Tax=Papaver somniferum TaxID=3469 RepID=UPI000E6FC945|nr:uncharacterized protein LOC113353098 [Papaver somniferum]
MESSTTILCLLVVLNFMFQHSISETILVDGATEWKNPSVHIGDSLVFKHKNQYKLYIFQNKNAFDICNFSQAILLTEPNSDSYMWNPSRPGFFYFAFNNGSLKSCEESEKFPIRVYPKPPQNGDLLAPKISPLPPPSPTSGGIVSSSPAHHWHFLSPQPSSLAPSPNSANAPVTIPSEFPGKGGSMPFINSNPAIPLPTGETDATVIRPLPASHGHGRQLVVGLIGIQVPILMSCVMWLMLY